MTVTPTGVQSPAIPLQAKRPAPFRSHGAETVLAINGVNAVDRRQLEAAHPGILIERQRPRTDHSMVRDALRRLEIALDIGIGHELHATEVRETFTTDRITREVALHVVVEARQVTDRVSVFAARQAAHRHLPRLTIVRIREIVQFRSDPLGSLTPFGFAWLRHALRRHPLLLQNGLDLPPLLEAVANRVSGGQSLEVNSCRSCRFAMALDAVLPEQGTRLGGGGVCRFRGREADRDGKS